MEGLTESAIKLFLWRGIQPTMKLFTASLAMAGQLLLASFGSVRPSYSSAPAAPAAPAASAPSASRGEEWLRFRFPYRKEGLTERQAAAHLLSRFTYGATPGQTDQVMREGLERWFARQLAAGLPDDSLN